EHEQGKTGESGVKWMAGKLGRSATNNPEEYVGLVREHLAQAIDRPHRKEILKSEGVEIVCSDSDEGYYIPPTQLPCLVVQNGSLDRWNGNSTPIPLMDPEGYGCK
nr:hypothetical protein [Tanacetum cinerariifolium]